MEFDLPPPPEDEPLPAPSECVVEFSSGPLGLELEADWHGRRKFVKGVVPDGQADKCGVVKIGMELVSFDGIRADVLTFEELLTMAKTGEISDAKTAVAVIRAEKYINALR